MPALTASQKTALARVDALAPDLSDWCATIFDHGETAWREYRSSAWYVERLRAEGFAVEEGSGGMPTAFCAHWSNGDGPIVGMYAEYDAVPGNCQAASTVRAPRAGLGFQAGGHTDPHSGLGMGSLGRPSRDQGRYGAARNKGRSALYRRARRKGARLQAHPRRQGLLRRAGGDAVVPSVLHAAPVQHGAPDHPLRGRLCDGLPLHLRHPRDMGPVRWRADPAVPQRSPRAGRERCADADVPDLEKPARGDAAPSGRLVRVRGDPDRRSGDRRQPPGRACRDPVHDPRARRLRWPNRSPPCWIATPPPPPLLPAAATSATGSANPARPCQPCHDLMSSGTRCKPSARRTGAKAPRLSPARSRHNLGLDPMAEPFIDEMSRLVSPEDAEAILRRDLPPSRS
jgi:hypothetical protein